MLLLRKRPKNFVYPSARRKTSLFYREYTGGWEVWGHEYDGGYCLYHGKRFVALLRGCRDIFEAHRLALSYIIGHHQGTLGKPDICGRVLLAGGDVIVNFI
ncbi:MAG: hypothetical protein LUG50_06885 [Planctomycetaceae bacterium]|nr:hypothetical protein [Planctomycetaceae bacterium]